MLPLAPFFPLVPIYRHPRFFWCVLCFYLSIRHPDPFLCVSFLLNPPFPTRTLPSFLDIPRHIYPPPVSGLPFRVMFLLLFILFYPHVPFSTFTIFAQA